ncbi:38794_t:CDS:1, partial [Gigaspora margarita]
KQGLNLKLNLLIPKKEIDTKFYKTLKTKIEYEMEIDKLENEYSKDIKNKKPNLEDHIYNELHTLQKFRIASLKNFYTLKEKISQARLYEDLKEDGKIFNMIKDTEFEDKILKTKLKI